METPDNITELKKNQIFVFGSNLAGIHGAGAALAARKFGAEVGVGFGPTGRCFAIPTKDHRIKTMPLKEISKYIKKFLEYASDHLELEFLVTKIGCGLAGYDSKDIGPMFSGHTNNVILPREFVGR